MTCILITNIEDAILSDTSVENDIPIVKKTMFSLTREV
jgi:hypothetical protein